MRGVSVLPEHVALRVENYRPQLLTEDEWRVWGPSIKDVVYIVRPDNCVEARRIVTSLVAFSRSLISWGLEPPISQHLLLPRIDRHLDDNSSPGSRRTRRTELIKLGRVMTPEYPWPTKFVPIPRSKRKPPYSPSALRSLIGAAEAQESAADRRLFQISLALGLNGHDGRSIPYMTREQVVIRDGGVYLSGDDVRPELLIKGRLGEWVEHWRERTEPEQLLVGSQSRFNSKISRLRADDGKTRLTIARLRTTYVVRLLEHPGLRQSEILALAGLTSTSSLDLYRCYTSSIDPSVVAEKHRSLPPLLPGWGF